MLRKLEHNFCTAVQNSYWPRCPLKHYKYIEFGEMVLWVNYT
jgi:hypothetical protein